MLLDRNSVISLLNQKDENFESDVITLNTLPEDCIFEVVVEDTVTAEYYDSDKDTWFRFNLDFDYFKSGEVSSSYDEDKLDIDLMKSLKGELYKVRSMDNDLFFTYLLFLIIAVVFFIVCVLATVFIFVA